MSWTVLELLLLVLNIVAFVITLKMVWEAM